MGTSLPSLRPLVAARTSPALSSKLAMLAERIACIESHEAESRETASREAHAMPTGWPEVDRALGGGLPCSGVHEWWHQTDCSGARCIPDSALIHLAWQALLHDEAHHPGVARRIVWIGRAVWPNPQAMVRGLRVGARGMFGATAPRLWPDARLVDRSLLVDAHDSASCLWAAEQSAHCAGVCAVIMDGAGLDLAATRRLQLAATHVLLLAVRPAERRAAKNCLSACTTRWRVRQAEETRAAAPGRAATPAATPAHAATPARAHVEPAWIVELERAKGVVGSAVGARAVITRAWEMEGVDAPPAGLVAQAQRRRNKKITRMAAQAAKIAAQQRREESMPHEPATDGPASYPMLSGNRHARVGAMAGAPRRARRAR